MKPLKLISHSPEQTQHLGKHLGKLVQAGDVLCLIGNLGSGKTCLTQGIAWGLGIKEYAFSPSFVIVRECQGRFPLYHIDFYRLEQLDEIVGLGLEEYFYGNGICVIEWAEKGMEVLPEEKLVIRLNYIAETERSFSIEAEGERHQKLIEELSLKLKRGEAWSWL